MYILAKNSVERIATINKKRRSSHHKYKKKSILQLTEKINQSGELDSEPVQRSFIVKIPLNSIWIEDIILPADHANLISQWVDGKQRFTDTLKVHGNTSNI